MITVQLLGGASMRSGDTPIAGPPVQRHRIALLALIVAAWPQPLSRDRAMALLWPERDVSSARRLLNLALHVLRSALGEDVVASTAEGMLFNPSSIRCDLHELKAAINCGDHEGIVRRYTGPLLDGFYLADSTEFAFWLDERRSELMRAYTDALRALAEQQEQKGDVHGWVATTRRLVAADPHSGLHARMLMRALYAAGDRAGAIQQAAEHAHRLRADLDLEPDPEVAAFAEQLRRTARQTSERADAPLRGTAVAVLPFMNLSGNPENEYFADGITEDVIAHLAKIRALNVISLTSVMPFKRRPASLREIGTALRATTLLDGSVRYAGDRVRIVARLVDIEADRNLWAETYDRQLTDIFAIQTDVALRIAAALEAELSIDEQTRVRKQPTRNLRAYHLFLEGRHALINPSSEALARAVELFQRAIALDPTFALAWADLAMAYTQLAEEGSLPPNGAYEHAGEAAANAVRFDPDLSEAHCALAFLKLVREFDWPGAESEFQRALELSPSNADAYDLYGRMCAGIGRFDDAIALLERAHELDPLLHRVDIATALLRAGQYEDALTRAAEAVDLAPDNDRAHFTLGWAYLHSGRKDLGIAEMERVVARLPGSTFWLGQLGLAYGLVGRMDAARSVLSELEERARTTFVSPYHFAYAYTGLGEHERAIDCLERAFHERTGPIYGIKGSFLFRPLREHPRFCALLRQLQLD